MYIKRVEIENLRCFKGRQGVDLQREDGSFAGWTVFTGRNGTGKTSLLQILVCAQVGSANFFSLTRSIKSFILGGYKYGEVFCSYFFNKKYFQIKVRLDIEGTMGFREIPSIDISSFFLVAYGARRNLGQPTSEEVALLKNPVHARLRSLFLESPTLSDAITWLSQAHFKALEGQAGWAALRDDVLKFIGDGLLPDGVAVRRVTSDGLWVERDGGESLLTEMSDGYRTVLALVVDMVQHIFIYYKKFTIERRVAAGREYWACPLPGIVLIDEVDAHLHPSWQQRIGVWFTEHFPGIQFIVTTHSPFICQAASSRGLIRLAAPGEDGGMRHVDPSIFQAVVNGTADDAAMSELFGLEHAHSPASERLRQEMAALEDRVLDGQATEAELQRYAELKRLLPGGIGEAANRSLRALLAT